MTEKDKNQIEKIAKQCARDYSMLKNKGVDSSSMPPRQWIRAWMQTHYNIIKLSGYFFREMEKALSSKYIINEGLSNLGLSSKVKSKHNAIDSVDNLEVELNKTVFEKMKKTLQENGFSLDSSPSIQEGNISYPTRCGKYTVYKYEDSFKSEKISYYDVLVYIDKIDDGVYGDEENLVLEIKINPSIEVSTSPFSNKIHIGFTRYDNVGIVGVKSEPFFLATVKDVASPQAPRKKFYLKNSLPAKEWGFKPGDIVESSTIDISDKSSLNFLEDFIGIMKTIRGYNEDRKRGIISFKRTEQADIHEQIIEVICKYAWKNTKKLPKNLVIESNLGLNSKVKKKFDKVDAIDNISDYVDLGLPSGTLWCRHNYGVDNEYECGNLYNHVNATKLDLLPGQLPSPEDFRELKIFCKHKISEVNGVRGMTFISNKNSNEIFFPIADHYEGLIFVKPWGYYWSSEMYQDDAAYNMKFDLSSEIEEEGYVNSCNTSYRSYGFLVRAVLKKANESNLGLNNKVKKKFDMTSPESDGDKVFKSGLSCLSDIDEIYEFLKSRVYFSDPICLERNKFGKYIKILFDDKNGYVIRYLTNSNYVEKIYNRLCIFSMMPYSRKETKFLETIPGLHCINPLSVKIHGPFCAFYGDNDDNNVMPIESLEAIAEYVNFIYRDRDKKKVDESALGLANKVKKQFKEDYSGDKVVNVLEPFFDCQDETGKQVKVYFSESDWKNKIFKWLYENVSTLKIKEDDEYRAKHDRSKVLVDDFITNKFEGGQISICLYHHEYSTWGPPSYITHLDDYFNGVETYPFILTAHNLGNYSFCAVRLWTQGSKWRLTSAAYYQDRFYKSKRCPQGAWRQAKKTVTTKDVPILNLLGTKKKKESPE